jgi:hypothetical protein
MFVRELAELNQTRNQKPETRNQKLETRASDV